MSCNCILNCTYCENFSPKTSIVTFNLHDKPQVFGVQFVSNCKGKVDDTENEGKTSFETIKFTYFRTAQLFNERVPSTGILTYL